MHIEELRMTNIENFHHRYRYFIFFSIFSTLVHHHHHFPYHEKFGQTKPEILDLELCPQPLNPLFTSNLIHPVVYLSYNFTFSASSFHSEISSYWFSSLKLKSTEMEGKKMLCCLLLLPWCLKSSCASFDWLMNVSWWK